MQLLQEELRQEKQNRERMSREKDLIAAEKYTLEQNLSVSTEWYFAWRILPVDARQPL